MASCRSPKVGADEELWNCTVCLQQYEEPRQLPCFHRYCRDCLEQLLERHQGATVVSCPECGDEFPVPTEGVDGFKADLYMISMIEKIKLRKILEDDGMRECYACLKTLKMAAYCSKCKDFLCHSCHDYHMTNNILRDHRAHVIDVKDQNLILDKLIASQEPPKCQSHPKYFCQLCCRTCCNLPICVQCIYGGHRNHDITEVGTLAVEEARKLDEELLILEQQNEKLNEISERMDRIRNDLILDVREKKEIYQIDYDSDISKLKTELETREHNYELRKIAVKEMYDKIFEEIKKEAEDEMNKLEQEFNEQVENSQAKLQILDCDLKVFMTTIEKRLDERLKGLDDISQRIVDATKRYENLTETARSVLETNHSWTSVECIPDICASIRVETEKKIPVLETSSRIQFKFKVKEDEKILADIEGIEQNDWFITGMTRSNGDNIVISGPTSTGYQSHITVINTEGKLLRQEKLKASVQWAYRVCAYLSQFIVSTVSWPNEIGLYNVNDGSYIKRNINGIVSNWPMRRYVRCLATDTVKKRILVGAYNSRDVYIFDDHLNFCHRLTLSNVIEYPWKMSVTEDKLLVCDFSGQRAYIVSMTGSEGKILNELAVPTVHDGCEWRPFSVCSERHGFIYMLWEGKISEKWKCFLVQYSKTGDQLPAMVPLYSDARCVTTIERDNRERILVATLKSGKLITYNLVSVCV